MKLNREAAETEPRKTDFIGFKEEPEVASRFREAAQSEGGASKVLQRFVRRYLRRRRAA